jgi:hypothetical protein
MGEYSYWSSRWGPAMRFALTAWVLTLVGVPGFVPAGGARIVWLASLAVAGIAWTAYAARAWGMCAAVDGSGVVVRNLKRTVELAWDDVERFDVEVRRSGRPVAVVRTRYGFAVPVHAIQGDLLFHTPKQAAEIEDLVAQLNGHLCRCR